MQSVCPKCNTPLETNAKFCVWCGVRLPESIVTPLPASSCAVEDSCTNCGKPFYPDSEFCIYCGAKKATSASTSSDTLAAAEKASSLVLPKPHTAATVPEPKVLPPQHSTTGSFSAANDFDD